MIAEISFKHFNIALIDSWKLRAFKKTQINTISEIHIFQISIEEIKHISKIYIIVFAQKIICRRNLCGYNLADCVSCVVLHENNIKTSSFWDLSILLFSGKSTLRTNDIIIK